MALLKTATQNNQLRQRRPCETHCKKNINQETRRAVESGCAARTATHTVKPSPWPSLPALTTAASLRCSRTQSPLVHMVSRLCGNVNPIAHLSRQKNKRLLAVPITTSYSPTPHNRRIHVANSSSMSPTTTTRSHPIATSSLTRRPNHLHSPTTIGSFSPHKPTTGHVPSTRAHKRKATRAAFPCPIPTRSTVATTRQTPMNVHAVNPTAKIAQERQPGKPHGVQPKAPKDTGNCAGTAPYPCGPASTQSAQTTPWLWAYLARRNTHLRPTAY